MFVAFAVVHVWDNHLGVSCLSVLSVSLCSLGVSLFSRCLSVLHVRRLFFAPQPPRCLSALSVPLCSLSVIPLLSLCFPSVFPLFALCLPSVFHVPCSLPDLHVCRHFHEDVCVASSPQSPLFCGHHRATQRASQSRTVAGTNGQVSDSMCMQATYSGTYSGTCITRVCTALLACVHVLYSCVYMYYTRLCTCTVESIRSQDAIAGSCLFTRRLHMVAFLVCALCSIDPNIQLQARVTLGSGIHTEQLLWIFVVDGCRA